MPNDFSESLRNAPSRIQSMLVVLIEGQAVRESVKVDVSLIGGIHSSSKPTSYRFTAGL